MRLCKVGLLTITLILAACSPAPAADLTDAPTEEVIEAASQPTDEPTSTEAPAPTDEATEAPTTETTTEPVQVFDFHGDAASIESGHIPGYSTASAGPIIYVDGMYYEFYTAFPEVRFEATAISYASSPDGIEWTEHEGAILTRDDLESWPDNYVNVTGALVEDDGTWILYLSAYQPYSAGEGRIYRATAPSVDGPWVVDADPIMVKGADGEWDDAAIWGANVIKTEDGYLMSYSGDSKRYRSSPRAIGIATSEDGITWTKYNDPTTTEAPFADSDPVLMLVPDSWEEENVGEAFIQPYGDGFIMTYLTILSSNERAMGLAHSDDGIHWERDPRNPILINEQMPGSLFFHTARLFCLDDECFVLAELVNFASGRSDIWRADPVEPLVP